MDTRVINHVNWLNKNFPGLKWPGLLFHYTDILNVPGIIDQDRLYSRTDALRKGCLKHNCAGQTVLDHTSNKFIGSARAYFRPRTPPLFHVEGFCTDGNQSSKFGSHCPVPVYLVFDALTVLSTPGVQFSDGNLSSYNTQVYSDLDDLVKLDFSKIYHNSHLFGYSDSDKYEIIRQRCAEVIMPGSLDFEQNLAWILCRSYAERETLFNMLNTPFAQKYDTRLKVAKVCFFRNNHFVERADLHKDYLELSFASYPDGFVYNYEFEAKGSRTFRTFNKATRTFKLDKPPGDYSVKLEIDDHIAYYGRFRASRPDASITD